MPWEASTRGRMERSVVEYFFYCRDRPGSAALRAELAEAHWSFMDPYAATMIARGPTLADDDETIATGSMHIVDLPDPAAARTFAFEEPNYRAGVYDEVLMHRWRNTLGRTMWDFTGAVPGHRRFLVIGHGRPGMTAARDELHVEQRRHVVEGAYRDRVIVVGPLLSDDDSAEWVGTALTVELPDRASAEALLRHGPYARAGLYERIEVHAWEFGGRRED